MLFCTDNGAHVLRQLTSSNATMSDPCPSSQFNEENPEFPPEHDLQVSNDEISEFRRQLRLILNKIAWKNYRQLRDEVFQLDVNQNELQQQTAAILILDKASGEPLYSQIYAQLCSDICSQNPERSKKFREYLIRPACNLFKYKEELDVKVEKLAAKLREDMDPKKRALLSLKLEFSTRKANGFVRGAIKFYSHLYMNNLLPEQQIATWLFEWHVQFEQTSDEIYVQFLLELLEHCCAFYYRQRSSSNQEQPDHFTDCINWITSAQVKEQMSPRMAILIMNFEDFVQAGFVKRNPTERRVLRQITRNY